MGESEPERWPGEKALPGLKVEKGVMSQGVQVAPRNWKRQENKIALEQTVLPIPDLAL